MSEMHATSPEIRIAFEFLDTVDLTAIFSRRASVMNTVPNFLRGPFRNAMRVAMEEAIQPSLARQERGWNLSMLLLRLLLHRPPRGGLVHKSKLVQRFDDIARGQRGSLLAVASECDEAASRAQNRKRPRQRPQHDLQRRAARALSLVQVGELSAGRQALEGADLAPGSEETHKELRNPLRRPNRAREPLPRAILEYNPATPFALDENRFAQVLGTSRKEAAPGPSGMISDHLRPVLESHCDTHSLFSLAGQLARAQIPASIPSVIQLGRMTALRKPSGGSWNCCRRYRPQDGVTHNHTTDPSCCGERNFPVSTRDVHKSRRRVCRPRPSGSV